MLLPNSFAAELLIMRNRHVPKMQRGKLTLSRGRRKKNLIPLPQEFLVRYSPARWNVGLGSGLSLSGEGSSGIIKRTFRTAPTKRDGSRTHAVPKCRRVFRRTPTNRCVNLLTFYPHVFDCLSIIRLYYPLCRALSSLDPYRPFRLSVR